MDLDAIQAGAPGAGPAAARALLGVLALGWGAANALRRGAYAAGLVRRRRLDVPVLSVGNLVAGGTGKTPFVAWLAEGLRARGRRPGILARGYGPAAARGGLSDEGAVLAHELGDGVAQAEDPDRVRGARRLLAAHPETDVLVLDDGFQHWRVRRDLDVVLLDATRPFGHGHLLPRGLLRERPAALGRADVVVLSRTERVDAAACAALRAAVARVSDAPVVEARTVPLRIATGSDAHPPAWLRGRPVVAVCGIGRPAAFFAMLEADLGATLIDRIALGDHARAPEAVWRRAFEAARAAGPEACVLTTRKDAVKLEDPGRVAVLEVGLEIARGEAVFWERVARALTARGAPPRTGPTAASTSGC